MALLFATSRPSSPAGGAWSNWSRCRPSAFEDAALAAAAAAAACTAAAAAPDSLLSPEHRRWAETSPRQKTETVMEKQLYSNPLRKQWDVDNGWGARYNVAHTALRTPTASSQLARLDSGARLRSGLPLALAFALLLALARFAGRLQRLPGQNQLK